MLILIFFLVFSIFAFLITGGDLIQSNVSINGINVSGLTVNEAKEKIKNTIETDPNYTLNLVYENNIWRINYKDIGFLFKYEEAVDEAFAIGHHGLLFENFYEVIKSKYTETNININFEFDKNIIINKVDEISQLINKPPIDATILLSKERGFVRTDEQKGITLKKDETIQRITSEIIKMKDSSIDLPVIIKEPSIKRSDLSMMKYKLAEYSTKFNPEDVSRTSNLVIATLSATDVLVGPGEIFSLNKILGPRLEKYGYKLTQVLVNSELVPGIGGGVCQVSSTLYNAALLSNLKIVETKNHSIPSWYVPLGRDATITGNYIDLKFQNTTGYPIYIDGEVVGNLVKFEIYGYNDFPDRTIKIETEILEKTVAKEFSIEDATLLKGVEEVEKTPSNGYIVKTYRAIYENGKKLAVEPISTSVYKVVDGLKRVGTKKQ